jgi:predicted acyltransferase
MFWIIGADSLVYALNRMTQSSPTRFLAGQLDHAEWAGFRFYDLIFPLFVFMMGVSMVFSLGKAVEHGGRAEALKRVFRRGILLFLVGLFYSGGLTNPWPDMRLMGVLNRIALAYFFGGLLFCFFKPRALAAWCAILLVGYWALLSFTPIRDIQLDKARLATLAETAGDPAGANALREPGNPSTIKNGLAWATAQNLFVSTTNLTHGKFEPGLNLVNHIDFQYLPGKKYDQFYDPEGLLSTLPAVVTCLLGVLTGYLLRNPARPAMRKVTLLLAWGAAGVLAGWLWNLQFPVIKKLWTSSYVLVAGGYSALLMALFYYVVDVRKIRGWCQPFVWMGMNSITVYLASNMLGGFRKLAVRLAGGDLKAYLDTSVAKGLGDLLISVVGLLLAFWFVRFLYQRKIFLRL